MFDSAHYHFSWYALPPFAVGLLLILLAVLVSARERGSETSSVFSALMLCGALWLCSFAGIYSANDAQTALRWIRIEHIGVVFIPPFLYLLALQLIRRYHRYRILAVRVSFILSALFVAGIFFTDWFIRDVYRYSWGFYPRYHFLAVPFLFFFCFLTLGYLNLYYTEYRRAKNRRRRAYVKRVLIAFCLAQLGSVDFLATFGVPVYPFGYLMVLGFVVILFGTVWRFRLSDITPAFAAGQIITTMNDALLVIDREEVIRIANPAALQMFGKPLRELVGASIGSQGPFFISPQKLHDWLEHREAHNDEVELAQADGSKIVLNVTTSVLRDHLREPSALVCIVRDVTEHRKNEETLKNELEQKVRERTGELLAINTALKRQIEEREKAEKRIIEITKELARSNQDLEQFAYAASHDLQEPLRMVASYTQLLADRCAGQLDPQGKEFTDYAREGAIRAGNLINGLLEYSRVGRHGIQLQKIDCRKILDAVLADLKLALQESGGQVICGDLPAVTADEAQLHQLFQNLISNALKFRLKETAPEIKVSAERSGAQWQFCVQDNGIGIRPEHFGRIFVIFQRLHTKEEYPGTGIGLAICKKIVERHKGKIWIESGPGGGTAFYFTLQENL